MLARIKGNELATRIYVLVAEATDKNPIGCTSVDIQQELSFHYKQLSFSAVNAILNRLRKKGLITRAYYGNRRILYWRAYTTKERLIEEAFVKLINLFFRGSLRDFVKFVQAYEKRKRYQRTARF